MSSPLCLAALSNRRHPERSRPSGGAKDLACGTIDARQIPSTPSDFVVGPSGQAPRLAGENAGLRDDATKKVQTLPNSYRNALSDFATVFCFASCNLACPERPPGRRRVTLVVEALIRIP